MSIIGRIMGRTSAKQAQLQAQQQAAQAQAAQAQQQAAQAQQQKVAQSEATVNQFAAAGPAQIGQPAQTLAQMDAARTAAGFLSSMGMPVTRRMPVPAMRLLQPSDMSALAPLENPNQSSPSLAQIDALRSSTGRINDLPTLDWRSIVRRPVK